MGLAVIMLEVVSSTSFLSSIHDDDAIPSVRRHRRPQLTKTLNGASVAFVGVLCTAQKLRNPGEHRRLLSLITTSEFCLRILLHL